LVFRKAVAVDVVTVMVVPSVWTVSVGSYAGSTWTPYGLSELVASS
jgi:hypothetical protein